MAIGLLLLVLAAAYFLAPSAGPEAAGMTADGAGQAAQIGVSPSRPLEGQLVRVDARLFDCPRAGLRLTLDGEPISFDWTGDGAGLRTLLSGQKAGKHQLALRSGGGRCDAALEFEVGARACEEGQNASCARGGGCGGRQFCHEGRWGSCEPLPVICRPGQKVSCSSNYCSFGFSVCNACGDAWSECRPPAPSDTNP